MANFEKTHKYIKNKQRLLIQLQFIKKIKIIDGFENERNMFGFSIKGLKQREGHWVKRFQERKVDQVFDQRFRVKRKT